MSVLEWLSYGAGRPGKLYLGKPDLAKEAEAALFRYLPRNISTS